MNLKLKSDAELTDTVKRLRGIISRPKWLAELPDKGKSIENSLLLANAEIARRREMQDAGTEAKVKADPSADNNGSQLNESLKEFLTNLPDKGKRIEKTLLLAKEEILRRGRERQSFESESKTKAAEGSQLKENWSLMAKLADRGENIKGLVNRIENELKARGELKNAGAQKVEADGGEKNEGTMVNEEVKSSLSEKASDPLLNDLKQEENEDLDPSAEQIILSETTTNGPDTAEEKTDDDEKKKGDGKHSTGESKEPLTSQEGSFSYRAE
ncbi:Hypothetical predicted protein [Cloeon dipterum]|uniref:Uncharacterized protein n=1 Tax=Cloeon dipterum TaxID=197152 RepID=A0A8S1DQQ0_9INSE|nr:Hypothetical predicted protein [Cloeon dipterum]